MPTELESVAAGDKGEATGQSVPEPAMNDVVSGEWSAAVWLFTIVLALTSYTVLAFLPVFTAFG